jgi:hypothetical protein
MTNSASSAGPRAYVVYRPNYACKWWVEVDGEDFDCYFTRWGAERAARKIAAMHPAMRERRYEIRQVREI